MPTKESVVFDGRPSVKELIAKKLIESGITPDEAMLILAEWVDSLRAGFHRLDRIVVENEETLQALCRRKNE